MLLPSEPSRQPQFFTLITNNRLYQPSSKDRGKFSKSRFPHLVQRGFARQFQQTEKKTGTSISLRSQDLIKEHLRSQLKHSEALHGETNASLLTTRFKKFSYCRLFPWVPMQSFIGLQEMSQAGGQGKRERRDCLFTCLLF